MTTQRVPKAIDVCTTTTQRVPKFNAMDVWNTLGSRCINVAGRLEHVG